LVPDNVSHWARARESSRVTVAFRSGAEWPILSPFLLTMGLSLILGMLDIMNLAHGSFYWCVRQILVHPPNSP